MTAAGMTAAGITTDVAVAINTSDKLDRRPDAVMNSVPIQLTCSWQPTRKFRGAPSNQQSIKRVARRETLSNVNGCWNKETPLERAAREDCNGCEGFSRAAVRR